MLPNQQKLKEQFSSNNTNLHQNIQLLKKNNIYKTYFVVKESLMNDQGNNNTNNDTQEIHNTQYFTTN